MLPVVVVQVMLTGVVVLVEVQAALAVLSAAL
jgi:hypothetical protein